LKGLSLRYGVIVCLGLSLWLSGCAEQEVSLDSHTKKSAYEEHRLMQTEKGIFYSQKGEVALLLTVTYLRQKSQKEQGEFFVLSLSKEHLEAFKGYYQLRLNGKMPKRVTPLSKEQLKQWKIPFISNWKESYLVLFSEVKGDKLPLIVSNSVNHQEEKLFFSKVAKYRWEPYLIEMSP